MCHIFSEKIILFILDINTLYEVRKTKIKHM